MSAVLDLPPQMNQPRILAPDPNETEPEFFERAFTALSGKIPNINRRTVYILDIWKSSDNASDAELQLTAKAHFPEDKFTHFGPRCVFFEHTVPPSEDGTRPAIVYDRAAMEALVNFANYRIEDTNTFSALSAGHTPSQEEKMGGIPNPDVLGYSGPFYIGVIGNKEPKWAVYADEWVHNEDVDRFMKLQRRSPEVWTSEPMERRTMDPIAALGAETPRLDSGMNPYVRASDGRIVMRYSMAASGAFPGPTNTFVPTAGKRRTRYGAQEMPNAMDGSDQTGGDPNILQKVGKALEALLPTLAQAVADSISGENEDVESQDDVPGEQDLNPEDATPRGMAQTNSDTPKDEAGVNTQGQPAAAGPTPGNSQDDNDERQYAAMGGDCYKAFCSGKRAGMMATQYSRGSANGAGDPELIKRVAKLELDNRALRSEAVQKDRDRMRYSRLAALSKDFAFEPDEDMETCIDMTDAQFDRHCEKTIVRYQKRDDLTGVELFSDPSLDKGKKIVKEADMQQYCRKAQDVAVKKNSSGNPAERTTFEAELNAILKANGID